ncbi:CBS domain protein [Ciceribacter lividus]|uniref:CBS domain protein n=2 Tax=Ciceribacter lividus TaxID=1197950 RepID=A0A6I7HPZ9_9HYPH|nr:CBS domain protein [Ciceribacter lividus]
MMSDFTARTTVDTAEGDGASDEGGNPIKPESTGRAPTSFWARAARILRPLHATNLREDLTDALLADSGANEAFSPEERAMLHNILRFREVRVEDVMIPRVDIEAVDQSTSLGELMAIFEESGRSRMPVYHETLDDPRGMVHIRDLLSYLTKQAKNGAGAAALDLGSVDLSKTVADAAIVRPVLFVPPSMLASDLLNRMRAARTQMALVIDEYGGTDGLVSHEDILEMVVGDIEDEHDDEHDAKVVRLSEDVFVADARVELEEIAGVIGSDFDVREQSEDVDTLGGLIFYALGRIPSRGEAVEVLAGFTFHILDADPRRIKRVRVTRKRAQHQSPVARADAAPTVQAMSPVGSEATATPVVPDPTH